MDYSIDTSSLITAWRDLYPKDVFPSFWDKIDADITSSTLAATDEVLHELKAIEDDLYAWAKERPHMFHSHSKDIQREVRRIQSVFPKIVNPDKTSPEADPFVISLAIVNSCTVISQERPNGNHNKPKIPDVCSNFSVKHINILGYIREKRWTF